MITLIKTKRCLMGAFVGALFARKTNKTNNKQHLNREYDSESDHLFRKPSLWLGFCFSGNGNP
ncbi:hypothetical protein AVA06_003903 [Salmonella enterica subsp. enterica]|nr:hypothetical protein [Salmonella enterica subsp. enterica]EDW9588530.1 hypothetical protein [Salmonella enterica subsp. enterica]EED9675078.1 hypothetical protein [Salmonella enterica subsp. enterica]